MVERRSVQWEDVFFYEQICRFPGLYIVFQNF